MPRDVTHMTRPVLIDNANNMEMHNGRYVEDRTSTTRHHSNRARLRWRRLRRRVPLDKRPRRTGNHAYVRDSGRLYEGAGDISLTKHTERHTDATVNEEENTIDTRHPRERFPNYEEDSDEPEDGDIGTGEDKMYQEKSEDNGRLDEGL